MTYDPRVESIKAYKKMIRYFKKQIDKLEREIFSERCCWEKKTRLPIANKKRIRREQTLITNKGGFMNVTIFNFLYVRPCFDK